MAGGVDRRQERGRPGHPLGGGTIGSAGVTTLARRPLVGAGVVGPEAMRPVARIPLCRRRGWPAPTCPCPWDGRRVAGGRRTRVDGAESNVRGATTRGYAMRSKDGAWGKPPRHRRRASVGRRPKGPGHLVCPGPGVTRIQGVAVGGRPCGRAAAHGAQVARPPQPVAYAAISEGTPPPSRSPPPAGSSTSRTSWGSGASPDRSAPSVAGELPDRS